MNNFVPDSDCKQGKCANKTTGCQGVCWLTTPVGALHIFTPPAQSSGQPVQQGLNEYSRTTPAGTAGAAMDLHRHEDGQVGQSSGQSLEAAIELPPKWEVEYESARSYWGQHDPTNYMKAEIAGLRRIIASQPPAPQATSEGLSSCACCGAPEGEWLVKPIAAPQASAQPAAEKLNYKPADEYKAWFDKHRVKLVGQSIFTKGAVIWNAALAATMPSAAPSGWKLVPVEPTEAMIDAAMDGVAIDGDFAGLWRRGLIANYAKLIAAAPSGDDAKGGA